MPRPPIRPARPNRALWRLGAALVALWPGAAAAHPHVFIETGRGLLFDDLGRLVAVEVSWRYDALYSLMMIADHGLDGDGDGLPDAARLARFAGQDVDWAAGFPGHLDLRIGGQAVALAPPEDHRAFYVEGRIITTHRRPLRQPVQIGKDQRLDLRAYDPEFFVDYTTPDPPAIRGRADCRVTRRAPDPSPADQALLARLAALDMSQDAADLADLPDVGIRFATVDEIRCGGR